MKRSLGRCEEGGERRLDECIGNGISGLADVVPAVFQQPSESSRPLVSQRSTRRLEAHDAILQWAEGVVVLWPSEKRRRKAGRFVMPMIARESKMKMRDQAGRESWTSCADREKHRDRMLLLIRAVKLKMEPKWRG